ncbi:MAG: ABC transporter permease subunit, partial [Rhizobiaceae bacterium]
MTDTASLPNASAEAGTDSQVTVVTNRSSVSERVLSIVIPIFMVLLAIAAWQAHIMINEVPRYIMPAPLDVVNALWTDWGTLSPSLLVTLRITVMALSLALLGGVGLAIILVQSRWIELALFPFAVILQVTPMIAIAPLLIIYMPDTQSALLTCAFVVAFFPILSNMVAGLKSVDHNLLNLFELYGASRWQTLIHLKLPSSLPYFAAGLRIG